MSSRDLASDAEGWSGSSLAQLPTKNGFRLRGVEVTRHETFVDAAFAFAITLLVISIDEIPGSYGELLEALEGTPAFAASFANIMMFWAGHRTWSRRYGLEDAATTTVSLVLVFVVLVYVYPLKLMFSSLFHWLSGGALPSAFEIDRASELTGLFVIYGTGFATLAGCMSFLYLRSLRRSDALSLSELERIRTREELTTWSFQASVGLASALFAALTPARVGVWAGFFYLLLALVIPLLAFHFAKEAERASA